MVRRWICDIELITFELRVLVQLFFGKNKVRKCLIQAQVMLYLNFCYTFHCVKGNRDIKKQGHLFPTEM